MHGPVTFQNAELDDLIIARSDGTPTYNFCVVVDDMDMGITHVIRGDDHLNNTPRQMNMLTALGATPPVYAHVPMILGPDGAKLSKRHGAVSVLQYEEEGYLPDALLNYLVRLGLVARRSGGVHARGDDRRLRHPRCQQGGLCLQSREAPVAEPAAHDARAAPATLVPYLRAQLQRLGLDSTDQTSARRGDHRAARARQDAEGDGAQQPLLLSSSRSTSIPRR